jgi:hypothetical protein
VVSADKPERDLVEKRGDYAEAGIPEYWIVNPENRDYHGAAAGRYHICRAWRLWSRCGRDIRDTARLYCGG